MINNSGDIVSLNEKGLQKQQKVRLKLYETSFYYAILKLLQTKTGIAVSCHSILSQNQT